MPLKKRTRRILLAIVLLLIAAPGIFALWLYRDLRSPTSHDKASEYIEIPRRSTPESIANKLLSEGVIRRKWPLLLYIKLTGSAKLIRAGEYRFPSPITPLGVLKKLEEGEQRLSRFTVIEGWTRWDIAESMAHVPELGLTDKDEALKLMDDTSGIRDLDPNANDLEGYLFPATYSYPPDTKAPAVIAGMVKRFRQEWTPERAERARALGMSPRQIVIIASLIETEAKLKEDRPLVASVIYNRLKKNTALGIDSTIIYASKLAGKWRDDGKVYLSDVNRRSPYNTRIFSGLPPGPVGNPGESSIDAALNPAQTDYLYYVRDPARDDGKHNFYNNSADFEKGVRALREWERTQGR
ncbi:MAG TPA: endolytic transglycosylase MltG [Pyrinomonadaceae bacterium]|nr:endolytic transglycosylase MltG [Pyrinomonadaceae bacterium]